MAFSGFRDSVIADWLTTLCWKYLKYPEFGAHIEPTANPKTNQRNNRNLSRFLGILCFSDPSWGSLSRQGLHGGSTWYYRGCRFGFRTKEGTEGKLHQDKLRIRMKTACLLIQCELRGRQTAEKTELHETKQVQNDTSVQWKFLPWHSYFPYQSQMMLKIST